MWRSGAVNYPKEGAVRPFSISEDILQETEGEIRANQRVTLRELHHIIPEVSKTTIREAVTEKLRYGKLCARWVPKMLTDYHKTKRMRSALKFLKRYAQKGHEFLDSIVTGDETWGFHHILNPSNSHCNGTIRIPPEPKNSKLQFQRKKPGVHFLGQKRHSSGRLHASWRKN